VKVSFRQQVTGECGKRNADAKNPDRSNLPSNPVAEELNLRDMGFPEIAVPAASLRYRIHVLGGGKVSLSQVRKVHESALCRTG
jgi:hypothetical protein